MTQPNRRQVERTLRQAQQALPISAPDFLAAARRRYLRARRRRIRATLGACALAVLAVLAGFGGVMDAANPQEPSGPAVPNVIDLWTLTNPAENAALQARIDHFNRSSRVKIRMTVYPTDEYKQRLPAAVGADSGPDIFLTWGAGSLERFVRAGQVVNLAPLLARHPRFADAFLPSVLAVGSVGGRQFGMPMNGMQPILLFYNKKVFAAAGRQPPTTYQDLLDTIAVLRARGLTPLALPGAQPWMQLPYLMYLVDRIGGPGTLAAIEAGRRGAWSAPTVRQAAAACQQLVAAGAFGGDFGTLGYAEASRRLAAGEAAMMLTGTWEYANQPDPDVLGWMPFPTVAGGTGDPRALVGVPANFFSISASSNHIRQAEEFLAQTLTSTAYLDALIAAGQAPPLPSLATELIDPANDSLPAYTYQLVSNASSFTLAFDQALPTPTGDALTTNLPRLFADQISPEQFATAMEQTS